MTSASYTVRTAESHEYADALEVLIAAFDGDPAMMAVIAGGSRRQELAKLRAIMTLQVYGNFQGRGRIDIAIDNTTGKIVGVCLWNTPESQEGSFANELKQNWRLLQGARLQDSAEGDPNGAASAQVPPRVQALVPLQHWCSRRVS